MRLVEADGRKIGVFHCADGELFAIEDRCSHDDGPLAEGEFDAGRLYRGVPAPRLAVRPPHGQAARPCRPTGRSRPSRSASTTTKSSWRSETQMTTPPETATTRRAVGQAADRGRVGAQGHRLRLQGEVRLPRPRDRLRLQGAQGPQPRADRVDLRVQERAAVDARLPPQGLRALREPPDPDSGAATSTRSTSTTSTTSSAPPRRASAAGTRSPRTSRTPSTSSASPRRSASSSPASAPSTSPSPSTTRSTRSSRPRA